jgi:lipoprotein-releasing system permease protein
MAMHIVGRGMIIGNIIGITICAIQALTGVVKLNPENYYLDTVPIMLPLGVWAALNIGAFLFTTLMMVAPSHVISRITPAKALRFN